MKIPLTKKKKKKAFLSFSPCLIWSNKIVLQRTEKASTAMAVCRHLLKMLCLLTYLQEYTLKPVSFNLSFSKLCSVCSQVLVQSRSNCSVWLQMRDNGVLS